MYERYQISNSSSHGLVRSCWLGVSIAIGQTVAEGRPGPAVHDRNQDRAAAGAGPGPGADQDRFA
jgi:hypothetical protein